MNQEPEILFDWRADWLESHDGDHVAILVPLGGDLGDDEWETYYAELDRELRVELNEATLESRPVDPYTGAGGYGLGFIWEIVGKGADIFAWVSAAIVAAHQVRKAATFLREKLRKKTDSEIFLSGEAIRVLCVAEICEAGVEPRTIEKVGIIEHKFLPSEPTVEKQQFHSAYTVTVEGRQPDDFYHVWSYLVTCEGRVVARSHLEIPMPNASHWSQVNVPTDKLNGLP